MLNDIDLTNDNICDYFYTNLFRLSKIEEGIKINITPDNIITIEEPYMFQGLWRYYNNISRNDAILVIGKLFDNIEGYYNSLYIKTCILKNREKKINMPQNVVTEYKLIIEKMKCALYGITNLKLTYKTDDKTIKELDIILENVNKMIKHFTDISTNTYIE